MCTYQYWSYPTPDAVVHVAVVCDVTVHEVALKRDPARPDKAVFSYHTDNTLYVADDVDGPKFAPVSDTTLPPAVPIDPLTDTVDRVGAA